MENDKSDLVRARVTPKLKADFEEICKILGNKSPAEKLRELVSTFVESHSHMLSERIVVSVTHPKNYSTGAWQVFIKLRDPTEAIWMGSPVPFSLPAFDKRRLDSDPEYRSVVGLPGNTYKLEMGGTFIDGEWRGHLYSNGVEEQENPTTINTVQSGLVDHIIKHLDRFKERTSH